MPPDKQQQIQQQMGAWAHLSPAERNVARQRYQSLRQLPPEQRQEMQRKWQEYQQLSPEQRRELANRRPPGAAGASPAMSPTPAPPAAAPK
jgi:hypothetical protein